MTEKETYLLTVIGNAPVKNMQEYRYKAELMLEVLNDIERRLPKPEPEGRE